MRRVYQSDCLTRLALLPAESMDSLVTDPPAGISFMGREWDADHGGREGWVKAFAAIFSETLRVLKPGAHGLVWALPRTSHWTASALEDAGFEVRDIITHHFGTGFPKSLDVSKAIDKAAGAKREAVGKGRPMASLGVMHDDDWKSDAGYNITAPATDDAKTWQGWGTALKPASEHWILVRKPLDKGSTVAVNVLEHGTGALNIDGTRIGVDPNDPVMKATWTVRGSALRPGGTGSLHGSTEEGDRISTAPPPGGRWPANLILSHAPGCELVGTRKVVGSTGVRGSDEGNAMYGGGRGMKRPTTGQVVGYADPDGTETVERWECVEGCPVAELDRQSGTLKSGFMRVDTQRSTDGGFMDGFPTDRIGARDTYGDSGGASRFFYVAKASTAERNAGLDDLPDGMAGMRNRANGDGRTINPICTRTGQRAQDCPCGDHVFDEEKRVAKNTHPTVKSIALMRYLCRLVTPPGGTVLDPFMGSGSTGVAALQEGFDFVGIERDADYFAIAKARILAEAAKASSTQAA